MTGFTPLHALLIVSLSVVVSGCFPKYIDYPSIHRIADERGVQGLTAWTLEQTDARTVLRALHVLRGRALGELDAPVSLMESYRIIMSRLDQGWPGLAANGLPLGPGQSIRERVLERGYESLAKSSTHERAPLEMRQTYLDLRPPESRQPQYDYWLKYALQYDIIGD